MTRHAHRSAGALIASMLCAWQGLSTIAMAAEAGQGVQPQGNWRASWQQLASLPDWSGTWRIKDADRSLGEESGRYPDNGHVPLTAEYARRRAAAAAAKVPSPRAACLPAGTPGIMKQRMLLEILFTPGRVTLLFEDGEVRRIHTDGRAHQPLDDLQDSYMGDSIGHWEGDTLVVDTIGFPNGSLWRDFGVTATIDTHLVERIALDRTGELRVDSVISDPAIFTAPYASTSVLQRYSGRGLTGTACRPTANGGAAAPAASPK